MQEHWVEWPAAVYDKVGNILLSRIMGADVRLSEAGFDIGIRPSWEEALASVEERGGKPYAIPAGGSDHPLGGLGFARWAQEVADQEEELGVFFDTAVAVTAPLQGVFFRTDMGVAWFARWLRNRQSPHGAALQPDSYEQPVLVPQSRHV